MNAEFAEGRARPLEPTPLMRLEAEAIGLVNAEPLLMPGLVQTAAYTIALAEAENLSPELTERRLQLKKARQLLLTKANPPKLDLILDETVLRRTVGSHAVMAGQLRALLEVANRPNLESQESVVYIEDQAKIELFQRHAAKVGKVALNPADSLARVATMARSHNRE